MNLISYIVLGVLLGTLAVLIIRIHYLSEKNLDAGEFIINYGIVDNDGFVKINLKVDLPEIEKAESIRLKVIIHKEESEDVKLV